MLQITKSNDPLTAYKNCIFINPEIGNNIYIQFNEYQPAVLEDKPKNNYTKYIFKALSSNEAKPDQLIMNLATRTACGFTLGSHIKFNVVPKPNNILTQVKILVCPQAKNKKEIIVSDDEIEHLISTLKSIPLSTNFEYNYNNLEYDHQLKLMVIGEDKSKEFYNWMINDDTQIDIISTDPKIVINSSTKPNIFNGNFNFEEMGIGGLGRQFEIIFRRAFASRVIPDKIIKDLGINHVRGIMLYGPPGTGKTLIARQIGKILNCAEPKIVNGPSLLSKYVGQSEENVRNLFTDAINDKSGSKLHLIICDEFDALVKKRGSTGDNTGTGDKIVNQFLSMIDGPESLNNILLICMTNRIDMIDEAMLRPGRLEVQIEIGLPDEAGRNEILQIHTKKMNSKGYLDPTVDLKTIATITKNFTGAELESVVKNCVSYSLSRDLDPSNLAGVKNIKPVITQEDFLKSAKEIKPQFGTKSSLVDIICSSPFELYSDEYKDIYFNIKDKMANLKSGNKLSFCICGPNYVGKTKMACHLAKESEYNCIKFVNSETLCNYLNKGSHLNEIFMSGLKSDSTVFIIDSFEKIIEYSKLGNIYNNNILQTVYMMLDKIIEPNNKVVIILTSSNSDLCDRMELTQSVDYSYNIWDNEIASIFKQRKLNN